MSEVFSSLRDFLQAFLELHQYKALIALIFVEEAGVPLPLPGDLAIAFMGYQVSVGRANPVVVLVAVVGSATVGASLLYWISRIVGRPVVERFGRYLKVTPEHFQTIERWFDSYGAPIIVIGRLVPGLRIAVAVAAGIMKVVFWQYALYTCISAAIWAAIYMGIGWGLGGQYENVWKAVDRTIGHSAWMLGGSVASLVLVGLVVGVLLRRRRSKPDSSDAQISSRRDSNSIM